MARPSAPILLLRAEAAALAVAMAILAWHLGPPWWLVVLVLVAARPRARSPIRSGRRSAPRPTTPPTPMLGPALVGAVWLVSGSETAAAVAALWALHIGVDRALGFGLKYPTAFGDTHLGRIGRG